jgi:hypothetical protein
LPFQILLKIAVIFPCQVQMLWCTIPDPQSRCRFGTQSRNAHWLVSHFFTSPIMRAWKGAPSYIHALKYFWLQNQWWYCNDATRNTSFLPIRVVTKNRQRFDQTHAPLVHCINAFRSSRTGNVCYLNIVRLSPGDDTFATVWLRSHKSLHSQNAPHVPTVLCLDLFKWPTSSSMCSFWSGAPRLSLLW